MMFLKNMASVIYGNEHMITMFVLVLEIYTDVQTSRSGHVIADASVPLWNWKNRDPYSDSTANVTFTTHSDGYKPLTTILAGN